MTVDHRVIDTSRACAQKYGSAAYMVKWEALPRCKNCERPMRPFRGQPLAWPATISRANNYACSSCYNGGFRHPDVADTRLAKKGETRPPKGVSRPYMGKKLSEDEDHPEHRTLTREQIAEHWSDEQKAAALQTTGHISNIKSATRVLVMLGMFDDPSTFRHVANLGSNTGSFGR